MGKTILGLVFEVELLSDGLHLAPFEVGDPDRSPSLGGTDHGAEHELEHGRLAEGMGDDLEPAALLDEEALEEIRGPDGAAVIDRHAQVGDAGLEVVHEARRGAGQLGLVVGEDTVGALTGDGP